MNPMSLMQMLGYANPQPQPQLDITGLLSLIGLLGMGGPSPMQPSIGSRPTGMMPYKDYLQSSRPAGMPQKAMRSGPTGMRQASRPYANAPVTPGPGVGNTQGTGNQQQDFMGSLMKLLGYGSTPGYLKVGGGGILPHGNDQTQPQPQRPPWMAGPATKNWGGGMY